MAEIQLGDLRIMPKHILDPQGLTDGYTVAETNDTGSSHEQRCDATVCRLVCIEEETAGSTLNGFILQHHLSN